MTSKNEKSSKEQEKTSKKKLGHMPPGPERSKAIAKALSEGLNRYLKENS